MLPWRNWLARSTVNRKVGGSEKLILYYSFTDTTPQANNSFVSIYCFLTDQYILSLEYVIFLGLILVACS